MDFSSAKQFDLHRRMVRIRLFEEAAGRLAEANKLPGFLHLYVGEEAVASGVCGALNDDDHITSTHRGHGHLVAKGGDFNRMMAELMGKSTGYCKGKGGSMHISDTSLGMLGANGIVGAGSPIAVGAAFANKYRGKGQVAVAFFGDGSTNIGAFHEAANMACALHLPIVFACENNEYGEFTPRDKTMAITAEYLNTRKQFGVAISSFQALRHRAADMKMQLELCRSMSYYASLKLNDNPAERSRAMSRAKYQIGRSMRHIGQEAVQLHGGIGVTDEYIVSHYFKKLTQLEMTFGDTLHHLGEVSNSMQETAGVFA